MVIYEYRCPGCGENYEILHKEMSKELPKCGECDETLERKLSKFSITHKSDDLTIFKTHDGIAIGKKICEVFVSGEEMHLHGNLYAGKVLRGTDNPDAN